MQIKIEILCSDAAEAAVVIAKVAEGQRLLSSVELADEDMDTAVTDQGAADQNGEPAKRKRRTKAEIEAARAAEQQPAAGNLLATTTDETAAAPPSAQAEPQAEAQTTAVTSGKPATIDDVRGALQKVVDKFDMDHARAFVAKQGFERVTAIPADKYASFIAACEKEAA